VTRAIGTYPPAQATRSSGYPRFPRSTGRTRRTAICFRSPGVHAHIFFGRSQQVRDLYLRITDPGTPPVILLYGQAGAGKSSLLDAGLLPRFEATHEVRYLRRQQEGGLLDTLRLAFLPEGVGLPINEAWRSKERETGKPLVVVLDQVEEGLHSTEPALSE